MGGGVPGAGQRRSGEWVLAGLGPRAAVSRRRKEVVQWAVPTLRRVRWRRPSHAPSFGGAGMHDPSATRPGSADAGAAPGSHDPLPGFLLPSSMSCHPPTHCPTLLIWFLPVLGIPPPGSWSGG